MKPGDSHAAAESWRNWEHIYDRFEQAWADNGEPQLEEFLPSASAQDRRQVLVELIHIDMERREARGKPVRLDDYVARFPELTESGLVNAASSTSGRKARPSASDDQDREMRPPSGIGRYELRARLGSGGFASVHRAWDPELGREVAIKIPRDDWVSDPEVQGRILREARSAAQLRHPAIVPLYEVSQDSRRTWLVYEYIAGPTLAEVLGQTRPAPQQAAQWTAALAEALDYAHRAGIVHRDVKPANVLMRGGSQPVLTDFGLALHLEAATLLTQQGDILGTPAYMSPEQAAGRGHEVDGRSDVYSLGVLLYEMLTGQVPFQAAGPAILHKVIHDEPTPMRSLQTNIPLDLETICSKAMAKNPRQRYETAGAFADDLQRYLDHQPIQARRIGLMGKWARWCRRQPALAATLAAAVIVIAAVIGFSYRRVAEERDRFRHERDRAQLLAADLAFDRGLNLCEQGSIGPGLLWLVRSLALSPDDAETQHRALRWNIAAWSDRLASVRHVMPHRANCLVLDRSQGRWITGGPDGRLCVWDHATGRECQTPIELKAPVLTICLNPKETMLWTGLRDRSMHRWDVAGTLRSRDQFTVNRRVGVVAHHPTKPILLVANNDSAAKLLESTTGKELSVEFRHGAFIDSACFTPDGLYVLTGGRDLSLRMWETETGRPIVAWQHPDTVTVVACSADGRWVASGCSDNQIRVWDIESRTLLTTFRHQGVVTSLAFAPRGPILLSGSLDRTARRWDVVAGTPLGSPMQHPKPVVAVAFGPDGQTACTACEDHLCRLWQLPGELEDGRSLVHDAVVWALAMATDGRSIVTASGNRGVKTMGAAQKWDAVSRTKKGPPMAHDELVMVVALSPDNETILTGSWDHTFRLWNGATGQPLGKPTKHKYGVSAVAFAPEGDVFVVGTQGDNSLRFWSLAAHAPTGLELTHARPVRAVAFNSHRKWILTGSYDRTAQLWDAGSGVPIGSALSHEGEVGAAALSSDGTLALTGSDDHWGHVWDLAHEPTELVRLPHQGTVRAVAFSPDGHLALTGSWDKTARLWEPRTGRPIGPPLPHDGEVEAVAFLPDGKGFVTGGWDRHVRFWRVPTPLNGPVDRIRTWIEALTGQELDRQDAIRLLDSKAWQERWHRLAE